MVLLQRIIATLCSPLTATCVDRVSQYFADVYIHHRKFATIHLARFV